MNCINLIDIPSEHPINKLTEIELAYIAGLVDGEGHLGIHLKKNGYHINGYFVIGTTDNILIPWLASKLEVSYCVDVWREGNAKQIKKINRGSSMLPLIIKILPHLKLKQRQAELLIELWYLQISKTESFDRQLELYQEMKTLNKKGVLE